MPYNKTATGDYSRINVQAMEYAETLQALALDSIREQFGVRKPGLDLMRGFTYQEYIDELTQAEMNGTREQFEADLAQQFVQMQTMAAQQAAAAAQQEQG